MKTLLIILVVFGLFSCATVHKTKSSESVYQTRIDTSSQEHQYSSETVTEEKGSVSFTTKADSVQTSGSISAEDTTPHQQTVETEGMSLTTTVKPKIKNGKVTGYEVNSKAVSKSKSADVPIDRKITKKETGIDKTQTGVIVMKKQVVTSSTKVLSGLNIWGYAVIIGLVCLFLLFVFIKRFK